MHVLIMMCVQKEVWSVEISQSLCNTHTQITLYSFFFLWRWKSACHQSSPSIHNSSSGCSGSIAAHHARLFLRSEKETRYEEKCINGLSKHQKLLLRTLTYTAIFLAGMFLFVVHTALKDNNKRIEIMMFPQTMFLVFRVICRTSVKGFLGTISASSNYIIISKLNSL